MTGVYVNSPFFIFLEGGDPRVNPGLNPLRAITRVVSWAENVTRPLCPITNDKVVTRGRRGCLATGESGNG
jgi:hypothetical protein